MKIRATKSQIDNFLESFLWRDMKREIKKWARDLRREYDQIDNLRDLGIIQGRREAIDYMVVLPEALKQLLEDQIDDARRDSTNGSSSAE
jgi:hypothetical protein